MTTQVLGGPGLYDEVGVIVCPCALGSPFVTTTYTFAPSRPLVMSSFFCLSRARARMRTRPDLNMFMAPPRVRVCVCPMKPQGSCRIVTFLLFFSRGAVGILNEDISSLLRYAIWAQIARTCEKTMNTLTLVVRPGSGCLQVFSGCGKVLMHLHSRTNVVTVSRDRWSFWF